MMDFSNKVFSLETTTSSTNVEGADQIFSITIDVVDKEKGIIIDDLTLKIGYRGDVAPATGAIISNRINPFRHRGMTEEHAAKEIYQFLKKHGGNKTPLLGRNINFDKAMLSTLLMENGFDFNILSSSVIDIVYESAKKIMEGTFPVEKLEELPGSIPEKRKYNLQHYIIAKALEVKSAVLYDSKDKIDSDLNIKIWNVLGRPFPEKENINDIFLLQKKYAGKIIYVKEWDESKGRVLNKKYFVTGFGLGHSEYYHDNKETILIRIDNNIFPKILTELKNQLLNPQQNDGLPANILKTIIFKKQKNDLSFLQITEKNDELQLIKDAKLLTKYVYAMHNSEVEKNSSSIYVEVGKKNKRDLNPKNFRSLISVIDTKSYADIPMMAQSLAAFSPNERSLFISKKADEKKAGLVWAYEMLKLVEKYGYRNKINGYEEARIKNLQEAIPLDPKIVIKRKYLDDYQESIATALKSKKFNGFEISCNGSGIKIKFINEFDNMSQEDTFPNVKTGGEVQFADINKMISYITDVVPVTAEDATKMLKGFMPYIDRKSFTVLKDELLSRSKYYLDKDNELSSIFIEILNDMGDYNTLIHISSVKTGQNLLGVDNTMIIPELIEVPLNDVKVTNVPISRAGNANRIRKIKTSFDNKANDLLAEEIYLEYNKLNGFDSEKINKASSLQIIALNLANPYHKNAARLDIEARRHKVINELYDYGLQVTQNSKEEDEETEVKIKCKICGQPLSPKSAVAGMGVTCAKKLAKWIHNDFSDLNIAKKSFKKMSECSTEDIYPLMIVRNVKNGKVFAADLRQKEGDGRFHVIDLTETAQKTKENARSGTILLQASQVYFDPEDHEVASLFKDKGL